MLELSLPRLAVVVGSLALSLAAGAGVASAEPDMAQVVNTTCTYPQAVSALNAENPAFAAQFNASPFAQSGLRQFLAAPSSRRQQMVQEMQSSPGAQPYLDVIVQIAAVCNNY